MKRSEHRILTTHVGSLIRPRALLEAEKNGDPARRAAHERELRQAVAEVVSQQAQAGIDVVNDGEFGKSGWANYSLERLSGFEPRPDKLYPAVWLGRDRIRFAEFMAAEFPRGASARPGMPASARSPIEGHASVRRDLDNLKAAAAAAAVEEAFFTAVAPGERRLRRRQRVLCRASANTCSRSPRRCARSTSRSIEAGFVLQVDDAVLANMYDHLVAAEPAALSRMGGAADRGAQSRAGGHPGGPHPLSHLLRKLARAARRRRAARGHRRSDPEGAGRRLFDRGRQRASRARVARVGEGQAAGRQDPDPGRDHASHRPRSSIRGWWPTGSSPSPGWSAART